MTHAHRRDRALRVAAAASGLVFVVLAAAFWIGTNTTTGVASPPRWVEVAAALGSHRVLPAGTVLACLALALAGRRAGALLVLVAVGGAGLLTYVAKGILQVLGADDDGGRLSDYPSGHTATTAALAGALLTLVWRATPRAHLRLSAATLAAAVTAGMSVARVEGGEHGPLDVLGGIALGGGWLACCLLALRPPARSVS